MRNDGGFESDHGTTVVQRLADARLDFKDPISTCK